MGSAPVARALISVSNKEGVVSFARRLQERGVEILSTGGTAKMLAEAGVPVKPVESYTGFPEMLDGRVKTLHPLVHGGILGIRENPDHEEQMARHGIAPIDLVAVNLYPFRETVAGEGVTLEEAVENIDIGGPTMIRSAAKNHAAVTVIVDPADYEAVMDEIERNGSVSERTRRRLAVTAFRHTALYDGAIDTFFSGHYLDEPVLHLEYGRGRRLRYGENPHQNAVFFRNPAVCEPCIARAGQLHGKELSYNNIVDADAALEAVKELADRPAAAVIKHTNPCGYATGETLDTALERAWDGDPVSAFGSVIAVTRTVDVKTARVLSGRFVEVLIAPDFEEDALTFLREKSKMIRLLKVGELESGDHEEMTVKHVVGGLLRQDRDRELVKKWECVTKTPFPEEKNPLARFAWKACKHVKSNCIVVAREHAPGSFQLLGMGAGQPNRVDALRKLAVTKARENMDGESDGKSGNEMEKIYAENFGRSVLASDAFFPFPDAIEEAGAAGIRYVVQPGGSRRDNEVIEACDRLGIAMVFTGMRHFRH